MADIFDLYDETAEPQAPMGVIPEGTYRATIVEGAIEPISRTSDKGECLNLTWKIETGPHDGRLLWQRINLRAANMNNLSKVIEIANAQFASVRHATGKVSVRNTDELLHIPCMIRVKIKKDPNGHYEDRNEIKSVDPVQTGAAVQAATTARTVSPAQASRAAPPPSNGGGMMDRIRSAQGAR
jgi:hypothetical protein